MAKLGWKILTERTTLNLEKDNLLEVKKKEQKIITNLEGYSGLLKIPE